MQKPRLHVKGFDFQRDWRYVGDGTVFVVAVVAGRKARAGDTGSVVGEFAWAKNHNGWERAAPLSRALVAAVDLLVFTSSAPARAVRHVVVRIVDVVDRVEVVVLARDAVLLDVLYRGVVAAGDRAVAPVPAILAEEPVEPCAALPMTATLSEENSVET